MSALEELIAQFDRMPQAQLAALTDVAVKGGTRGRIWTPQHGPQTEAYQSPADETLYGGAVGGGKTDLAIGLALTAHERSLIFRAQSTDLDGLWDRLLEVAAPIMATNNSVKKKLRTHDGRVIEGGHLELPGAEKTWQGRPHDLIAFDEAAQLDELKVEFVMRWLRSTTPGQRKRVLFATNPPVPKIVDGVLVDNGVGDWLLRWFAPWLDDRYPLPAKSGELRWCFMRSEGDRLVTIWVPGPGAYDPETCEPIPDYTEDDLNAGRVAMARSRTFIRSLLKDNVFLKGTGYAERMSGTPEPLRSMLLLGDFTVRGEDHPMQVIPTQWVLAAQARWEERQIDPETKRLIMLVLFGDVAQGGADTSVLAPLYTTDYFGELTVVPGHKTPDGVSMGQLVLGQRRHGALVGLDGTGGWAGSTAQYLRDNHRIEAELVVSSHGSAKWTKDMMFRYANIRSEQWWEFREALDPQNQYEICLPPDPRLRAQLTAPHWEPKGKLLYIESKDDLRKRLGSSTDEADAVIGAWHLRALALMKPEFMQRSIDIVERMNGRGDLGRLNEPVEFDDPLAGW